MQSYRHFSQFSPWLLCSQITAFLFKLSFYSLSNSISTSDLVMGADRCEMTICISKLIISVYYPGETQAVARENNKSKRQKDPVCVGSRFTLFCRRVHIFCEQAFFAPASPDHNLSVRLGNVVSDTFAWHQYLKPSDLVPTRSGRGGGGGTWGILTDSWLQRGS